LDVRLTEFQHFQLQLGFSFGGFGLHSPAHACRAANLASGIEYLRYKIEKNSGSRNNPSEWIRSTVDSMEPSDKYSADIIADAYEYYQNCKKAAAYFWIQKESADERKEIYRKKSGLKIFSSKNLNHYKTNSMRISLFLQQTHKYQYF